jgi:transcription termination/antitermination protein NusG
LRHVTEEAKLCKAMPESDDWKVVYTASRQEKVVAARLERDGIECYLPLVKRLRIWSDRKKWVEMPLFNGYMFVRPTAANAEKVLQVPGVVAYVRYNGAPARVRNAEITSIKQLIDLGYAPEAEGLDRNTPKGTAVRISEGPLKGMTGEVFELAGKHQFVILLETIEQTIRVQLPAELLEVQKHD